MRAVLYFCTLKIQSGSNSIVLHEKFIDMKYLIILFIALLTGSVASAQFGYEQYIEKDGLKISTKWSTAKNEAGEKKKALLFKVKNENDFDAQYSMEILFYYEGILRERGVIDQQCLSAGRSSMGKLNGQYFIPTEFTEDQLDNPNFNFELESIEVEEIESCE